MKTLIACIVATFTALSLSAQLQFTEMVWDFGDITEGEKATHVFVFKNVGKGTEQLQNVKASCGCTTPRWTRDPLQPGQSGEIEVTYNSKGRPGTFTKSITVNYDTTAGARPVILTIKGKVSKPDEGGAGKPQGSAAPAPQIQEFEHRVGNLSLEKAELAAGVVSTDKPGNHVFQIRNHGDKPVKLLSAKDAQPMYSFSWQKPTIAPGETITGTLHIDPSEALNSGLENKTAFTHVVGFDTDDADTPVKTFNVRGSYRHIFSMDELAKMPRIQFSERDFEGGNILQGDVIEHTFTFRNAGQGELILSSVKASCGCTTPEWTREPLPPGQSGTLKVVFNSAGKSGPQHKTVVVRSNDPEDDTVVLNIKCNIQADPFTSKSPVAPTN